ncbi:hypothetical protein [Lentzea sp. NPDC051838]|uniref:hypothetical protein n=1 Tax=Lentzea sp. NPDC051838 TaxID=3154849 RepID=UPI00341AD3E8
MNSSIKIALVAAVAVAGITACTSTPAQQQNAAPQTSSNQTSETPPPPVVTEVVTQTVTNPPKPVAALKLGMTLDEARAAGLTDLTWDSDGDGTCVGDGKVSFSKKYGVVRITLAADAKTPKGIGVGSTFGDVKRAYADASEYRGGWSAKASDTAYYSFVGEPGSDANEVQVIKLGATGADCAMYLL